MERDLDELHTTTDKCCEILQRTRDGDELEPGDLYLTECAINGFLTEAGVKAFDELHRRVLAGEYKKPWLHGVEPMTRDHEGYIYYKDKQVEHFSKPYVYSLEAARDLAELRNRCAYLERNGIEVSCANVVWGWENHRDAYGKERQAELDRILDGIGITFSKIVIDNNWNNEIEFYMPGVPDWQDIQNGPEFADLYKNNDHDHGFEVSIQSYHYGKPLTINNAEATNLIPSCFAWLQSSGLLEKVKSQNFMFDPDRERDGGLADELDSEQDDEAEDSL